MGAILETGATRYEPNRNVLETLDRLHALQGMTTSHITDDDCLKAIADLATHYRNIESEITMAAIAISETKYIAISFTDKRPNPQTCSLTLCEATQEPKGRDNLVWSYASNMVGGRRAFYTQDHQARTLPTAVSIEDRRRVVNLLVQVFEFQMPRP